MPAYRRARAKHLTQLLVRVRAAGVDALEVAQPRVWRNADETVWNRCVWNSRRFLVSPCALSGWHRPTPTGCHCCRRVPRQGLTFAGRVNYIGELRVRYHHPVYFLKRTPDW